MTTQAANPGRLARLGKEILHNLLLIVVAFTLLRGVVQNFRIEGHSMDPTLNHGQYLLVNKLAYFHIDLSAPLRLLPDGDRRPSQLIYPFGVPARGEIVVFRSPTEDKDYIKRIIALPGEHVAIRDGAVYINGKRLEEFYLSHTTSCQGPVENCDMQVPADSVYVLGDNRAGSSDSRMWRALPLENMIGRGWLSYWPPRQWGIIPAPSYALPGGR